MLVCMLLLIQSGLLALFSLSVFFFFSHFTWLWFLEWRHKCQRFDAQSLHSRKCKDESHLMSHFLLLPWAGLQVKSRLENISFYMSTWQQTEPEIHCSRLGNTLMKHSLTFNMIPVKLRGQGSRVWWHHKTQFWPFECDITVAFMRISKSQRSTWEWPHSFYTLLKTLH